MMENREFISANWKYQRGFYEPLDVSSSHQTEKNDLRNGLSVAVCTYRRGLSLKRFLSSMEVQSQYPASLIVVDASPDVETEQVIKEHIQGHENLSYSVCYLRVDGYLRGLTRQRNLALDFVQTDLVAFFDDDIVLEPNCLKEMEVVARRYDDVVGVGAFILGEESNPGVMLNVLHRLGAVPDLTPGKYHRSGLAIPVRLLGYRQGITDVDRLQGCCMLMFTNLARKERFKESFHGYAQSEDLDFSRRLAKYGRLVISGEAQVRHFHEAPGRPDQLSLGRMGMVNRYLIYCETIQDRRWRDTLWFIYAQFLYILFMFVSFLLHKQLQGGFQYVWGALLGVKGILQKEFESKWNNS